MIMTKPTTPLFEITVSKSKSNTNFNSNAMAFCSTLLHQHLFSWLLAALNSFIKQLIDWFDFDIFWEKIIAMKRFIHWKITLKWWMELTLLYFYGLKIWQRKKTATKNRGTIESMKNKNQQLEHIIYMDIWHVLLTWKREENGWKWKE